MNYFLDTCVELGYVFCTDPWNNKTNCLFDKQDDTYYISYCVNKEFNKKYMDILKKQKNFLYSLLDELKNENSSKKLSLNNLIIKSLIIELKKDFEEDLKKEIVKVLWKRCKSKHTYDKQSQEHVCSVKDLINYIKKFIRGFERKIIKRLLYFQRQVIEIEKRTQKYEDLNKKLLSHAKIHYPDNCIILDAHHLSLNDNINLNFITADNKMIKNVNNIIDLLSIDKFYYLKDFC